MRLSLIVLFLFPTTSFSGSRDTHVMKINRWAEQLDGIKREIHRLTGLKDKETDKEKLKELLAMIVDKNKELKDMYKDYLSEKRHFRYEHPEGPDHVASKYIRMEEAIEEVLDPNRDLEARLHQILRRVDQAYHPLPKEEKEKVTSLSCHGKECQSDREPASKGWEPEKLKLKY